MIQYTRFRLDNGLRVLVHEDDSTPMVAVNICYYVGARDEAPDRTGFAHLFEHLMFGGSVNAPDFDDPLQLAGGENNAFTNNDITNFYDILPAENLELALWLESDRMINLKFSERNLAKERKVVVEEFKETCLNEPYGDVWHHLADLAYKVHPYRWPTIGKVPRHVEEATLPEVRAFYDKYYRPNNAVLTIVGNVTVETVRPLVEKWFADIPAGPVVHRRLPAEPQQQTLQQRILHGQAPADALYLAFHVPSRVDADFYTVDLLSDLLGNGPASRLYQSLLKDQQLVTMVDCYITGTIDPGLLIIEAKPAEGVTLEAVAEAVWKALHHLQSEGVSTSELTKLQNKVESNLLLSEMTALNKAINLAFFEILGNAELINQEAQLYRQVQPADLQRLARQIFTEENCSAVYYTASAAEAAA
ncbi:MAG: insulinase family protein [Lewinella sp.]|nr:insulinase family protein [Lewinella sp.]